VEKPEDLTERQQQKLAWIAALNRFPPADFTLRFRLPTVRFSV